MAPPKGARGTAFVQGPPASRLPSPSDVPPARGPLDSNHRGASDILDVRSQRSGNGDETGVLRIDGPEVNASHDADLVRRARVGDRAAFEDLYRAHVGRVYALCLRISADEARAEELTQDVFVQTWRRLESFRGESAFSSWLYRVAVNVAMGALRSERRRTARVMAVGDLTAVAYAPAPPRAELAVDLERALTRLPDGARTVFVLHDVEGFKHEEIAGMLGIALGTAKAQLHRARKLLRDLLEP